MANRNMNRTLALHHKMCHLGGKIALSASAGAIVSNTLLGMSVVKSGTGLYTITLQDKYMALIGASLVVADNAALSLKVELQNVDVSGARTIQIVTKVSDTAANVTEALDIYVMLHLSNSSVDQ